MGAEVAGVEHRQAVGLDAECVGIECRVVEVGWHYVEVAEGELLAGVEYDGLFQAFGNPCVAFVDAAQVFRCIHLYVAGYAAHVYRQRLGQVGDAANVVAVVVGEEQCAF